MFFTKKTDPELEQLLKTLHMDMANNYKDAAQDDFKRVKTCFEKRKADLPEKLQRHYSIVIEELESVLAGYTHKDQPVHAAPKN